MYILRMAAMAHPPPSTYLDDTSADDEEGYDMNSAAFFKERMKSYIQGFDKPVQPLTLSERPFFLKERYLLLRVIEHYLLRAGVTIFGGYCRDMIIHHSGAKRFYESEDYKRDTTNKTAYTDPLVDRESFRDRNTYPKDIDVFISDAMSCETIAEDLMKKIKGTEIREVSKVACYSHHPSYTSNFGCKRMEIVYSFNSSLQKKGEKIVVSLDFVYSLKSDSNGPWKYLIDAACNMLYMNSTGLHCAFEDSDDPIENANRLVSVIELVKNRVTFIPPMPVSFRCPAQEKEILNIQISRNCTEMQAIHAFRKAWSSYRVLYRIKYLQRIAKLVKEGWTITNLNIKFTTSSSNTNGEDVCAISHEDLVEGKLNVRLGVRGIGSEWTQTCVISWSALVEYVFQMRGAEDYFAHRHNWLIVCPISKAPIDITETRAAGVVIREASRTLQADDA